MGTARAQFVGVPKPAALLIAVDKRYQRMVVTVDGQPRFKWSVSTGARGYATEHQCVARGKPVIHSLNRCLGNYGHGFAPDSDIQIERECSRPRQGLAYLSPMSVS